MTRHIGVVAQPDGPRWLGFAAAARRVGLRATCVPWTELLSPNGVDPDALSGFDLARVDSPGEDVEADALLCGRRRARGEVLGAAAWTSALGGAVRRVAPLVRSCTPPPDDVAALMDKAACHARLRAAGLAVVPALAPVGGWDELVDALRAAGWQRVFVKPRFGSSGAGVLALATSRGRFRATGHLECEPTPGGAGGVRLFNRSRPVVLRDERVIATVVDALAPEGLHVERWAPKVVMGGGPVDLRVVCVAGRATHVVARRGAGPVTNLHAGGARVDLRTAREALGAGFSHAVEAAEQVAAVFPRCLALGVDVGVLTDRRTVAIFEANAFGDLLLDTHDLHGRRRSTWDAQAAALADGWEPPSGALAA